jgi:hypothetical protein
MRNVRSTSFYGRLPDNTEVASPLRPCWGKRKTVHTSAGRYLKPLGYLRECGCIKQAALTVHCLGNNGLFCFLKAYQPPPPPPPPPPPAPPPENPLPELDEGEAKLTLAALLKSLSEPAK